MISMPVASGTSDVQVIPPRNPSDLLGYVLWGYSSSETAGTADVAEAVIRHGVSSSAPILVAPINFAADGHGYPTFFPFPLPVPDGLFLDRVSGDTTFVFYVDKQ
jgi:hypothetical protein